jgi:regulator of sigma E protease
MRLAVLLAGVVMNFIFGVALLSVLFTVGAPAAASPHIEEKLTDRRVELIFIAPNSPAANAGLRMGDRLLQASSADEIIYGENLNVAAVRELVGRNLGEELTIKVLRGREELTFTAHTRPDPPEDEGPLGIAMADVGTLQYPWPRSIIEAFRAGFIMVGNIFAAIYFIFRDIIVEGRVGHGIAGPVGIVQIAGHTAELGIMRMVNFAAILSINLAVLNILPIPALDGGRILFLAIERIRGRPVSRRVEQAFHAAGMAFLIGLILLITVWDIRRL